MRKTLATFALAGLYVLALSACNGNSAGGGPGVSALPNTAPATEHRGRGHRDDTGPQSLHSGGADFPAYAYNLEVQPVGSYNQTQSPPGAGSLFATAPTTGTIYYCINNSGDGRKAFEGEGDSQFPPTGPCAALAASPTGFGGRQDPLDFVGTATALASTECCASGTPYFDGRLEGTETWGQPFEFPQIAGLISFPFVASNFAVSTIKFSTWTYCAISNGTVSNWNDPAITADNGGTSVTGGVSEPITFYFRSDSSGTTFNFENALDNQCNITFKAPYNSAPYGSPSRSAAWTFGVGNTWAGPGSSGDPNPNFIGESGAPNILAEVQTTPFSTGYLEGSYAAAATKPKVAQAELQNGYSKKKGAEFVAATSHGALVNAVASITTGDIQYGLGSDGNSLNSTTPWCQLDIPANDFATPPAKTYPIIAVSYLLFYGQNNGLHTADKITLINYLESTKANKLLKTFEYTNLSTGIETAAINALNGNTTQAACVQ
jgi:ABC-type phosphate transport system substrate-binding protein